MFRLLCRTLCCLAALWLSLSLAACEKSPPELTLQVEVNRAYFVNFASATATITATARRNGKPVTIRPRDVAWTVERSFITAPWWDNRSPEAMNGLAWGDSPIALTGADPERLDMSGNAGAAPGGAVAQLTDIVGSRMVTVQAVMTIDGKRQEADAQVTFGPGPLSVFASAPKGAHTWADAARACGGAPGILNQQRYQPATKLPTFKQLQNVSGPGAGGNQGAAHAAGWPEDRFGIGRFIYWTDEPHGDGERARAAALNDGDYRWTYVIVDVPLAVCLP